MRRGSQVGRQLLCLILCSTFLTWPIHIARAVDSLPCSHLVYPAQGPEFAPAVTPGTNLVSVNNVVYFVAGDDSGSTANQKEFWRTDGTPTGTSPIQVLANGFVPRFMFTTINNKVLLIASTPEYGSEIWVSDGSSSGTRLLKDTTPGSEGSYFAPLFTFQNRFYFSANDQEPNKLWVTDGSPEHTILATEIYSGEIPTPPYQFVQNATTVYFFSYITQLQDQLWRLDASGMHKIKDFVGVTGNQLVNMIGSLVIKGERLYFFHSTAGVEGGLWRSDGTAAGTQLISKQTFAFSSGIEQKDGVYPELISLGNDLFFLEHDTPLIRLWRVDTNTDTVSLVKTIRIHATYNTFYDLSYTGGTVYEGKFYFALARADQNELWVTDGTESGTQLYTFLPTGTGGPFQATPSGMFALGEFNDQTLTFIPWSTPYPAVICDLGTHLYLYPALFAFNQQIYVSGRESLPVGREVLWHIDPVELHPTNLFLPLLGK